MSRLLRVLLVEDSEDDALLLLEHLRGGGYEPAWERAETRDTMAAALARREWDVVLSDYNLPRFTGPEALALLQEKGVDVPFILVSGVIGEEAAVAAMRAGAHDYVPKGSLARLIPAIEREMGDAESRRRQRQAEAEREGILRDLQIERERLQTILEALPVGVLISDAQGHIVLTNEMAGRIWGGRPPLSQNIADRDGYQAWWTDTREPVQPHEWPGARALLKGETSFGDIMDILRFDGDCATILNSAAPLREDGHISGAVAVIQDISQQRQAQTLLAQREREFRTLAENSPDIIARFDRNLRHLYVSPSIAQATGRPQAEFIGRSNTEMGMPAEHSALWEGALRQVFATGTGTSFEFTFPSPDGPRHFHAVLVPEFGPEGAVQTVLNITRDVTDLKRVEAALRQAKEDWERTFDSVPDLIAVLDSDHRIVRANRAMAQRLGMSPRQTIGLRCYECVHGSHHPLDCCPHVQTLVDGEEHVTEVHDERLGGDFLVSTTPLFDEEGQMVGSVHVARDITERKQAEEALRESEERFRQLADAMPQLVWTAQPDGTVDYYNGRVKEFCGFSRDSSGHWQWTPVLHPDDAPATLQAWDHAIRTGTLYQIAHRVQRADGTYRWYLSRGIPVRDEQGNITRWYGTATDIDDEKRAEERLRFLAEASRTLASSLDYEETLERVAWLSVPMIADWCFVDILQSPDRFRRVAVAHTDPAKAEVARAFRRSYAVTPDVPRGVSRVIRTGEPELLPDIDDALLRQVARDAEHLRLVRATGMRTALSVPILARGETLGVITFGSTQANRYEAADQALVEELARRTALAIENARLYRAAVDARAEAEEANRAKDQFVALVSHELRNPLSAIQAGVGLLRRVALPDARSQRALEIVERNTRLQARLVNDLLDLSRIQRGKLQLQRAPVDLARVVVAAEQASTSDLSEAGLSLTCSVEPDLWVYGDFDRLQQVVMNLLNNATKFTPAGGAVRVTLTREGTEGEGRGPTAEGASEGAPRTAPPVTSARLVVEDTGIGIEQGLLQSLFEMFQQGEVGAQRKPGLGVGLALVKGIVERHGGRVWAESDGPGKGSRFIVELPLVGAPALGSRRAREAAVDAPPIGVLLVEDNPDTRTLLTESLTLAGYEVCPAGSGEEALEILRQNEAPAVPRAFRLEVMLVDLGLPGMDGFDFLRRARELPAAAGVPAFAVTGLGSEEDVRRGREAGFAGHFVKPLDVHALDARIREWFGADGG